MSRLLAHEREARPAATEVVAALDAPGLLAGPSSRGLRRRRSARRAAAALVGGAALVVGAATAAGELGGRPADSAGSAGAAVASPTGALAPSAVEGAPAGPAQDPAQGARSLERALDVHDPRAQGPALAA